MNESNSEIAPHQDNGAVKQKNPWKTFSISLIAFLVLAGISLWVVKVYIFPTQFKPVELNAKETTILNGKLEALNLPTLKPKNSANSDTDQTASLQPEAYSEDESKREVSFSETEVNALLAHNTDLADKLAIDFSDNLASAKLLIPVDPEFPILGGKTLKLTTGIEISYQNENPQVVLRGVSLWGVPMPDAWLGNIKNVDLVKEFSGDNGFWKGFSEGVEFIEVQDGFLKIKLKP